MRKHFFLLGILVLFTTGCQPRALLPPVPYTDAELHAISADMQHIADAAMRKPAESSRFVRRLARLTQAHGIEDGLPLRYAVYISKIAAASATPAGEIRLSSALMDMMTDNELLFLIGHEIGHIYEQHSLALLRQACIAAHYDMTEKNEENRDAALRGLFDMFVGERFTAAQEAAADAYARQFMTRYGYDVRSGVTALRKLEKLPATAGMRITHPHSGDRARELLEAVKKR
ncbi:MAG: M48 family metalloprotease [Desulfovibrionaceae bacterium]|nr:M48 family metalloprotease [Desulfovibrionaceae bacterium]